MSAFPDGGPRNPVRRFRLALARTIVGIIPMLLVIFMIVEFHALNDMIAESDTDISVRLYVARRCGCAAANIELCHGAKPGRKVDFVGRAALNPGPTEALSAAGKDQMDPIGLGFCRTYTHEPAVMCCGGHGDKYAKDGCRERRYEKRTHPVPRV